MGGKEGARLRFRAKCPFLPGIYRLYILEGNGDTLPLGVLLPEGGGLALERTVNRPRGAFPGLAFFQYGVLCEGDAQPEPLAARNAVEAEKRRSRSRGPMRGWIAGLRRRGPRALRRTRSCAERSSARGACFTATVRAASSWRSRVVPRAYRAGAALCARRGDTRRGVFRAQAYA